MLGTAKLSRLPTDDPNKPATLNAKESHLKVHLLPRFGGRPLDEIDDHILKNARGRKLIAAVPLIERNEEGTPKNGRSRTLDLPASAVAALKAHRHLRGTRVFLNLAGEDYSLGEWRHGLYRACKRAGLREVGWHSLRHTFASHLAMRGGGGAAGLHTRVSGERRTAVLRVSWTRSSATSATSAGLVRPAWPVRHQGDPVAAARQSQPPDRGVTRPSDSSVNTALATVWGAMKARTS